MGLQLAPGLSFCLVEDRIVFLDLEHDRYFRLDADADQAFRRLIAGSEEPEDTDPRSNVSIGGLIRHVPEPGRPVPVIAPACNGTFVPNATGRPAAHSLLRALADQVHASWLTRHRRLGSIIARLRSIRPNGTIDAGAMSGIVRAHAQADLLYSAHDRCLAKSIALLAALRRSKVDAHLIFGVTARPFAAHCWVQSDGMVLNGDVALTRLFTPILVV